MVKCITNSFKRSVNDNNYISKQTSDFSNVKKVEKLMTLLCFLFLSRFLHFQFSLQLFSFFLSCFFNYCFGISVFTALCYYSFGVTLSWINRSQIVWKKNCQKKKKLFGAQNTFVASELRENKTAIVDFF